MEGPWWAAFQCLSTLHGTWLQKLVRGIIWAKKKYCFKFGSAVNPLSFWSYNVFFPCHVNWEIIIYSKNSESDHRFGYYLYFIASIHQYGLSQPHFFYFLLWPCSPSCTRSPSLRCYGRMSRLLWKLSREHQTQAAISAVRLSDIAVLFEDSDRAQCQTHFQWCRYSKRTEAVDSRRLVILGQSTGRFWIWFETFEDLGFTVTVLRWPTLDRPPAPPQTAYMDGLF